MWIALHIPRSGPGLGLNESECAFSDVIAKPLVTVRIILRIFHIGYAFNKANVGKSSEAKFSVGWL